MYLFSLCRKIDFTRNVFIM